jgi:hypothetical protein
MAHVAGLPWQFHTLAKYPPLELPARARDRLWALTLWQQATQDVRLVGQTFQVSRATLYRWRARWDPHDARSLQERSRRPHSLRRQRVHVHRGLLSRHAEVILADDVVAVEHATRQVAGYGHGHSLGDTRAHLVPGRGAAQVVEQPVGDPEACEGVGDAACPERLTFQTPWPEFSTQFLPCRLISTGVDSRT